MATIRIAHLSDLHASARNAAARPIVEAAITDLARAHSETPIDIVAFSGDLAQTGKAEEYELAHDWLIDPLRDALDLDMCRFALVPGNHDVDRGLIDKFQEAGMRRGLTNEDEVSALIDDTEQLHSAVKRLSAWEDYHALLADDIDGIEATPLGHTRRLQIDSISVGVAALNTAWRSADDEDKGFLLVGQQQLEPALAAISDCDLRLVLMHHPYPWLAPFDANESRDALEDARTLVLSGHDHKADPTAEFSLRGSAIYSRAGCLYENPKALNGYTLLDVDLERGKILFSLRSWYPAPRRAFDQALGLAENGTLEMGWAEQAVVPVKANYSAVLESLGQQASDLSVVAMLQLEPDLPTPDRVLVEPKLWSAPYREIAAARDLDGAAEPESVDAIAALDDANVVVLVGEPESGVSGSLLWILATHFEQRGSHTPLFNSLSKKFKAKPFDKTLRRNAAASGQSVADNEDVPPSIIAFDDAGASSALPQLVEYISAHDEHAFLLGAHLEESEQVVEALEAGGVEYRRVYIGPLGRAQVRSLIEKLGGLEDEEVDRIFNLIVSQHLPRTPLLIAALIVAIQQNQDPSSFNESALLDACIRVLLSFDHGPPDAHVNMDPRHREHLLSWFAGEMTVSGKTWLSPAKAEQQFAKYFHERGWSEDIAPGDVLASLIGRRILFRTEEGVGFRHEALMDLFTGKRINEDPEFASRILEDPIRHANAIRHAAGLRRDARELLAAVDGNSEKLLTVIDGKLNVDLFDRIKDEKGWSDRDPDLESLKAIINAEPVEPDQEEEDQQLDRLYDGIEYENKDNDAEEPPGLIAELYPAMNLASGVLKHSELVADVTLKEEALKRAIHGWGLIAIMMAVEEDQTDEVRDRVEAGDVAEMVDESEASLDRLAELMTVMIMAVVITGSLASSQLEQVTRNVLEDEEFMIPTAHALFTTLFYVLMRFPGWDKRLLELDERHGTHPLVRHLVFSLSASIYRSPGPSDSQIRRLESFLAERVAPDAPKGSGGVGSGMAKSSALKELRQSRRQALMARRLAGPSDLDLEGVD